ncbi:MAG: glycosyltransferase family 4 protein [Bacteroidota bacterium]
MNPQKHITYILSDIDKALAFEWIFQELDAREFNLSFILINQKPSFLFEYLIKHKVVAKEYVYASTKGFIKHIPAIIRDLRQWKTDIVHTHLLKANLAGLLSARLAGVKKRIHTRHHATFHHVYAPKAVKYDHFTNFLSTDIVAISDNVKKILTDKENVRPQKISIIKHGFDLTLFSAKDPSSIESVRKKYNPHKKAPVIGVISRYIHWKGIQYIIPAFHQLLKRYPNAYLLLANAQGPFKAEIQSLLATLPQGSYCEIEFEKDIASLYQLMDIFVHVPIDRESEAFGQIYVEALASGIPSIFTLSGIAAEFIKDGQNALTVNFQDSEEIFLAMGQILENSTLKNQLIQQGIKDVSVDFSLNRMIDELQYLYRS